MTFLHGAKVTEATGLTPGVELSQSSIVGIVGTSSDATIDEDKPVLISSDADVATLGTGWLGKAAAAVRANKKVRIVAVLVAAGVDADATATALIGETDEDGVKSGMQCLLIAKSVTGYKPKILICEKTATQSVATAFKTIGTALKAAVIIDCPSSITIEAVEYTGKAAAKKYATLITGKGVYMVWPQVKVQGTSSVETRDMSPYAAGVFAKTDEEVGFWESPSNHTVDGILGVEPAIDFELTDATCTANELNEGNVNTIIREQGFRLWGNHTTASEAKWKFINVCRISDMLAETILSGCLWAMDRGIKKKFVESVVEYVNKPIRDLIGAGGILGGGCFFDRNKNSDANIALGKTLFSYRFTPAYPNEQMEFEEEVTSDYIKNIFADAA